MKLVRDMLMQAVERLFDAVKAMPHEWTLEFFTGNGTAYIAHETRSIAKLRGLNTKGKTNKATREKLNGGAS